MMSADSKLEGGNEQGNSTDGVPDLGSLLHLEMPDVIQNLHVRYSRGQIYTSVSSILVAVNPYKSMPYYGTEFMEKYSAKGKRETVEPHIYNIAENAFRALALKEKSQSIIVCGESGAGKSESAKLLMKHLAFTTSRGSSVTVDGSSPPSDSSAKPKKLMRRMSSTSLKSNTSLAAGNHTIEFHDFDEEDLELNGEAKEVEARVLSILAVNPILEAFGNAKTVLNNNSSRFGKFTKLQFGKTVDDDGKYIIQGSAISTFLLETSRVVLQSPGERNYHVFYQILYGLTKERRSKWGLTTPQDFRYCNQSNCYAIPDTKPDSVLFRHLKNAMMRARFSSEEIIQIFQLIAGILHLGNIEFITNEKEDCLISQESLEHLEMASELFGISLGSLRTLLTYRHIKVGEAIIAKPYDLKAAVVNRDSTAKSIYKGVFDWIVAHINSTMAGDSNGDKKILDIGILDIFGFEVFEDNSFEQLCINLTNERLQHYFNNKIVLSEQKDYIQEAIVWTPVSLPDNKGCIQAIADRKYGLMAILDSTCRTPNADHKAFTQTLFSKTGVGMGNRFLRKAKEPLSAYRKHRKKGVKKNFINGFLVAHYARDVVYNAREFIEKNSEKISSDLSKTVASSTVSIAQEMMAHQEAVPSVKSPLLQNHTSSSMFSGSSHSSAIFGSPPAAQRQSSIATSSSSYSSSSPIKNRPSPRSPSKRSQTVGAKFLRQLKRLMHELDGTEPRFIRCIKPNLEKKCDVWAARLVEDQLESGGLIQALKIIKLGFPTRIEIKKIYALYKNSCCFGDDSSDLKQANPRDVCEAVLFLFFGLSAPDIKIGLTKIFFRENMQDVVSRLLNPMEAKKIVGNTEARHAIKRHLVHKKLVRCMAVVKAYTRIRNIFSLRHATVASYTLQAFVRGIQSKNKLQHKRRSRITEYEAGVKRLRAAGVSSSPPCNADSSSSSSSSSKPVMMKDGAVVTTGKYDAIMLIGTQISRWMAHHLAVLPSFNPASSSLPEGREVFVALASGTHILMLLKDVLKVDDVQIMEPAAPGSWAAEVNARAITEMFADLSLGLGSRPLDPEDISYVRSPEKLSNALARLSAMTPESVLKSLPILTFHSEETGVSQKSVLLFGSTSNQAAPRLDSSIDKKDDDDDENAHRDDDDDYDDDDDAVASFFLSMSTGTIARQMEVLKYYDQM